MNKVLTLLGVKGREESEEKSTLDSDSLKPETFCMEGQRLTLHYPGQQ
jgi:hypothetical protein